MFKFCIQVVTIVAFGLASAASGERPTGPVNPVRCVTCHEDVKGYPAVHAPVGANGCSSCHRVTSIAEHTYELAERRAALCRKCHDRDLADAKIVHQPVSEGDCIACHHPHGGPDRNYLRASTMGDLCESCHGDVGGAGHVHAPVAAGDCTACHSVHSSSQAMLLTKAPRLVCLECHETVRTETRNAVSRHDRGCASCHDPHASDETALLPSDPTTLCLGCHDRDIELDEGGTLSNIKMEIESGAHLHGPVSDGDCTACHASHGSEHFRLLNDGYPAGFYASYSEDRYALCFGCHDDGLVRVPSTTTLTGFRDGDVNLHFVHVNREKKGRSCRACHDVHAGANELLLRDSVLFGRGGYRLTIGHEQTAGGGRCSTGCHETKEYDRNLSVDALDGDGP